MSRKYDPALLEQIVKNQHTETVEGVPILIKPIPEGGEDGDMDPRVYKSMKSASLAMGVMNLLPKSKKTKTPLETVLPLRKMFGEYKGAYIADEGVACEEVRVASADGCEVPMRVYTRENHGENLPVFVYYHGGGFFGGGPDIVEQMCKLLVQQLDCVAFNIDYRLCPESHYPQPLDDCWYATRWIFAHAADSGGDPNRLAVAGDSAGGNLAAVITLRDREEKTGMVKLQVLLYPAVNIAGVPTEFYKGVDASRYQCSPRHEKTIKAVLALMTSSLGGGGTNMLDDVYLQGYLDPQHIYASPLLDDFHSLPPTLLIFGEHDFLAFEDFAYAQTAHKAGVQLKTIVYRGLGHGFADQIGVQPQAEDCMREIAAYMHEIL